METQKYRISGMCCDHCIVAITEALKTIPAVVEMQIRMTEPQAVIQFEEEAFSAEDFIPVINDAGHFSATLYRE